MGKIGIFYGPVKGRTAKIAEKLHKMLGQDKVDIYPIDSVTINTITNYDNLIFGVSTLGSEKWDSSGDANHWGAILPKIKETNFAGKKVALFGLGDHVTYAARFVDAMGEMADILGKQNAQIVGHVSAEGYTFTESKALVNGMFVGLPLDEDYESDKTDERLTKWADLLKKTFI
jgi:flavodoxin I